MLPCAGTQLSYQRGAWGQSGPHTHCVLWMLYVGRHDGCHWHGNLFETGATLNPITPNPDGMPPPAALRLQVPCEP